MVDEKEIITLIKDLFHFQSNSECLKNSETLVRMYAYLNNAKGSVNTLRLLIDDVSDENLKIIIGLKLQNQIDRLELFESVIHNEINLIKINLPNVNIK